MKKSAQAQKEEDMRKIVKWNENWEFFKGVADVSAKENGEIVSLPHTWNAVDGQDGGNDYFRGTCLYVKKLSKSEVPEGQLCYLEIRGAPF